MDFNTVLMHCGNFSYYQFILLIAFAYINVLTSLHYFAQTIITFTPEHFCYQNEVKNLSFAEIRDMYARAKIVYESCYKLIENKSDTSDKNPVRNFEESETKCTKWIYNYEQGFHSISTELDWVCDHAYKPAVGQSLFFIGSVLGTLLIGFVADKYGRLPAFLLSACAGGFGDFVTLFTDSLKSFAVARFIAGLSVDTVFYTMYIMVFEYLKPEKRTFGLNIIVCIFYTMGLVISPWLAIWVATWRRYLLVTSLPTIIVLCYPLFVCESAQWLITRNRLKEAVLSLKFVACINGRQVPENVFKEFEAYYLKKYAMQKPKSSGYAMDSFLGLFRTPRLRKFTLILLLKSMLVTLSYDMMSRNMEGLGTSPFYLFSITSIVYMPAGLTIIALQNRIGRRGTAFCSMLLGSIITGLTAALIAFLDLQENAVLLVIMIGLGRYGTIAAFDADTQHTTELIPTSVRGQSLANVHVAGYAFNFLSSYIIYWGTHYYKPLPTLIVSVLMLVGAVLCLTLPETLNKKLADTLAEGEQFGKDDNSYDFPCLKKKIAQNSSQKTALRY